MAREGKAPVEAKEKSPAFQFYPRDFLVATEGMDPAAGYAYWVLCLHSWFPRPDNNGFAPPVGYLSPDEDFLGRQSRLTPAAWRKHKVAILARFKIDESDGPHKGLRYHSRIVEEWTKQQQRSKNASVAGKASDAARNGNGNGNGNETSTDGQRPLQRNVNESATETPTDGQPKLNPSSASAVASSSAVPRSLSRAHEERVRERPAPPLNAVTFGDLWRKVVKKPVTGNTDAIADAVRQCTESAAIQRPAVAPHERARILLGAFVEIIAWYEAAAARGELRHASPRPTVEAFVGYGSSKCYLVQCEDWLIGKKPQLGGAVEMGRQMVPRSAGPSAVPDAAETRRYLREQRRGEPPPAGAPPAGAAQLQQVDVTIAALAASKRPGDAR